MQRPFAMSDVMKEALKHHTYLRFLENQNDSWFKYKKISFIHTLSVSQAYRASHRHGWKLWFPLINNSSSKMQEIENKSYTFAFNENYQVDHNSDGIQKAT